MSSATQRIAQITAHLEKVGSSLQDKICIVTGAGSQLGIGRATAYALAKRQPKAIFVTDLSIDDLPELAQDIEKTYNIQCLPRAVDAASEQAVQDIIQEALTKFGRLDVFVANAGVTSASRLVDESADSFMQMMRVNALSAFLAVKYAGEAMQETGKGGKEFSGGSIIATASVAGLRSGAGSSEYSASKAAVINLCQTAACQYAGTNVRVNAICPGLIETGMTKFTFDYARSRGSENKLGQLNPTRRYGISPEIANVIAFLASEEASYMNGQAVTVDGGLSASLPVVPGRFF
ncbi:hypothetical protein DFQ28_002577 [Apophysomyces sp. BC1034]|nr:hypothetical protein DFQ30_004375 [Apophysomyces sp. BC1015]KAG0181748.1 hypothetical protein DFQ29_007179 [Apophysomyces sp. BC1021]KAG0193929.1 hypothetical protein DFQ28_002577 [Apophysomyces sp. BC1034]